MKTFFFILNLLIIFFISIFFMFIMDDKGYTKAKNEFKSHLKDTVIIKRDTFIVVDYNLWKSKFYLYNGDRIIEVDSYYLKDEN
jgi:hypothetical protein